MSIYNPLNWQNEQALSGFPFSESLDVQDLIVDAKFVQFDGFQPLLNYIYVSADSAEISMTFDYGIKTITLSKTSFSDGGVYHIYEEGNYRYLGLLSFGLGVKDLFSNYVGRNLEYNLAFDISTVRSIPSQDAVYLFDGNYGDVELSRSSGDKTIFYNLSLDLNSITFNAVTMHNIEDYGTLQGLKKINLVPPLNNNINLASNDVVKVNALNSSSLTLELVAGSASSAFIVPTLNS